MHQTCLIGGRVTDVRCLDRDFVQCYGTLDTSLWHSVILTRGSTTVRRTDARTPAMAKLQREIFAWQVEIQGVADAWWEGSTTGSTGGMYLSRNV